jgi:hypothetical protein
MERFSPLHLFRAGPALCTLAVLAIVACGAPGGQRTFGSPEAAFDALVITLEREDTDGLQELLGPGVGDLLESGDAVQDAANRRDFVADYRARHSIREDRDGRRILLVGAQDWPLPIPAVRRDGRWILDGEAGADELVLRRIGANELGAIAVARGFVEAQREYAGEGRDGDPAGIYALKLVSDPGLHNGLYWETVDGEMPSPAGEFVAAAAAEGYRQADRAPYHGYRYRMLYGQGSHAAGGAREYFQDGLLTRGFALVAWPAEYGSSGVMTFQVNQDGQVFQKDLGEGTDSYVESMRHFDPDSSWTAVPP